MPKAPPPQNELQNPSKKSGIRRDPIVKIPSDITLGTPKIPAKEVNTDSWLTRNDSADMLHVSVNTVANYERKGKLHPRHVYRPDARGIERRVAVYDPDELVRLPHPPVQVSEQRPGEVAARCFELFANGKTIAEAVVALRETPDLIRTLHEDWLNSGGADLQITPVAKVAFEKLVGSFTSTADLLESVAKALAAKTS